MDTPIFDAIKKYKEKKPLRFHMPGHKGKEELFGEYAKELISLDVTELDETDNLAAPRGAILKAEEEISKAFSAVRSFILTGGSTLGNLSMIYGNLKCGDKILLDRNSHLSVFSALVLSGADPIYIGGGLFDKCGALRPPSAEEVLKAAKENPDAKAVFITSPNSFGVCADLFEISKICKEKNMLLLVDEAHGAHFAFHKKLPETAMKSGADAAVQSFHKTLPALTQTAVLHIGNGKIKESTERALRLFQSSSPSYLLTASADFARAFMDIHGKEKFDGIINFLENNMPQKALKNDDILRLCIKCDGRKSENILKRENIVPEMCGAGYAVFIITAADSIKDIGRLLSVIKTLPAWDGEDKYFGICPKQITPHEAFNAPFRTAPFKEAAGKISKNAIFRYPPGVPVVAPGEEITKDALEYIEAFKKKGDVFSGVTDIIEICNI
ncbi:MAG: aminotransferase class I/II-fold pyridoxal phosphate-dependent enzyme [Clostridia bacterium]|nr:aminotransferase class I/II-fold pyridoxal phosphate-dependent enzyme [Clostridia bacterium]